MRRDLEQRFEFALYLDEMIICKRQFRILLCRNIDDDMYGCKDMFFELVSQIQRRLKSATSINLLSNYDSFKPPMTNLPARNCGRSNLFRLDLVFDSDIFMSGQFEGNCYPPKVRYKVDIRPIVKDMIGIIRTYLEDSSSSL